ncbi:hypothetical protein F2Q70_00033932 [Brassica cretica]|uniref:Uncharacterized protein n=1 Tax=Brassica cretica TaxID=69181 RepID=A0A8S9JT68_BRACR|nr:hypothetical protein F2Q70_00033932 [Brassica cretica]
MHASPSNITIHTSTLKKHNPRLATTPHTPLKLMDDAYKRGKQEEDGISNRNTKQRSESKKHDPRLATTPYIALKHIDQT